MQFLIASLLLLGFSAQDDICGRFPKPDFGGPGTPKHRRSYTNSIYGFSVRIPKGLTGYSATPPSPEHGVGIVLSWEPRAYIYFGSRPNATLAKNTSEIAETHLRGLGEEAAHILNVQKYKWRMGGLIATRYKARHTCKQMEGTFIEDETLALYKGNIYIAQLLTTETRYIKDKAILEEMLRTWRPSRRE